jgi:hypothetical protein
MYPFPTCHSEYMQKASRVLLLDCSLNLHRSQYQSSSQEKLECDGDRIIQIPFE